MGLQDEVKRLILVDYFLVEVDASARERTTDSGIVVVEDSNRTANFGKVMKTPDYYRENVNYRTVYTTKDGTAYTSNGEAVWVGSITEGDTVFFRTNATHEPIELSSGEPDKEYIMVHIDNVLAFYTKANDKIGYTA